MENNLRHKRRLKDRKSLVGAGSEWRRYFYHNSREILLQKPNDDQRIILGVFRK
jgi:hypothetical protein